MSKMWVLGQTNQREGVKCPPPSLFRVKEVRISNSYCLKIWQKILMVFLVKVRLYMPSSSKDWWLMWNYPFFAYYNLKFTYIHNLLTNSMKCGSKDAECHLVAGPKTNKTEAMFSIKPEHFNNFFQGEVSLDRLLA